MAGWQLVSVLLKKCTYNAILISTSRDHVPCMSSGHLPSLLLMCHESLRDLHRNFSIVTRVGLTCFKEAVKWET